MSLKKPLITPGIDPGSVRLVAQRLNHYAIPGPQFERIKVVMQCEMCSLTCECVQFDCMKAVPFGL